MRYLLDTDTCIDLLRGVHRPLQRIQTISPDECSVSTITTYELLTGALKCRRPKMERRKVEAFVEMAHEVPFDRPSAEQAANLRVDLERQGVIIGPYDIQIAAQALARNLTLVTSNRSEFGRVEGLHTEDWRE